MTPLPRTTVIAGNWKLHRGPRGTESFLDSFLPRLPAEPPSGSADLELLLFPPALSLEAGRRVLAERFGEDPVLWPLGLGVQQIHPQEQGAFTGENSGLLAREAGATHALVGHSERRALFGESDSGAAERFVAAVRAGLTPVFCVGETLEERRAGLLESVLRRQLAALWVEMEGLGGTQGWSFRVAYEPVWAIGTGETATPEDAQAAHAIVRHALTQGVGEAWAESIPILYGGSVKPENAGELLAAEGVDGLLVGGSSLDPESFLQIMTNGLLAIRRR
jgi:triosephosphate isomerase (TIM)